MECPVGSSCLPSKIRSGLSLVYVKWSLFISQHPLIPLLKKSGVEQLCMHPGTPGCDGLKLYPIRLTLSSLYFISHYRLFSNGAVFQEMQGGKNLCLPELFSFNIQCRAKTQISVCPSLIAASFCPCVVLDELLVLASACCCYWLQSRSLAMSLNFHHHWLH